MNAILIAVAMASTFTVENRQSGLSSFEVQNLQASTFTVENFQTTSTLKLATAPTAPTPAAVSRYPLRNVRWNVNGNMNPSHAALLQHLQSGQHAGKWSASWLSTLSYHELRSLHDDDHEGRVSWSRVVRPVLRYRNSCPNGRCPR